MAMMIREYIDGGFCHEINESAHGEYLDLTEDNSLLNEPIAPDSLMVDIEGIHAAPHATRNYTRYMPSCLKKSVPSWTKPYRRPLIKHHNEKNGEIIGRVCATEYKTGKTLSGTTALLFTVNVPGLQAKDDVKSGLLETTSIGVIAHDVRCSICGQQLASGETCDHERGMTYGGETCYWDIYSMEAKELSYVIVPSDMYAKNVKIYPASQSGSKTTITESLDNTIQKGETEMSEQKPELEQQLTEATAKITELEAKVSELTESVATTEAKVQELTAANTAATEEVAQLKEANASFETKATEEAQLKEGLETALAESKAESKQYLIEALQALRKVTGKKEVAEASLLERTEESLRDSFKDLKEEMSSNGVDASLPTPGSLKSPSLTEEADDKKQGAHVKESSTPSNIDLKAGLESLFTTVASAYK